MATYAAAPPVEGSPAPAPPDTPPPAPIAVAGDDDRTPTPRQVRAATPVARNTSSSMRERIVEWVCDVLDGADRSESPSLHAFLRTGVVLCDLANKLVPGAIDDGKIYRGIMTFRLVSNAQQFVDFCSDVGVGEEDLFKPLDLVDGSNLDQVLQCLDGLHSVYSQATQAGQTLKRTPKPKEVRQTKKRNSSSFSQNPVERHVPVFPTAFRSPSKAGGSGSSTGSLGSPASGMPPVSPKNDGRPVRMPDSKSAPVSPAKTPTPTPPPSAEPVRPQPSPQRVVASPTPSPAESPAPGPSPAPSPSPSRSRSPAPASAPGATAAPAPAATLAVSPAEAKTVSPRSEVAVREQCCREIQETERTYLKDMEDLLRVAGVLVKERFIMDADRQTIFSNLQELVKVGQEVLAAVDRETASGTWEQWCVGKRYAQLCDKFHVYQRFCVEYPTGQSRVQSLVELSERLAKYLEDEFQSKGRGEITDHLIKPVQRICKYPLLFRELLKATPESHPDHKSCRLALERFSEVTNACNEAKRTAENRQKVRDIEALIDGLDPGRLSKDENRRFLQEELVTKTTNNGKPKDRFLFLFSDCLLYAKRSMALKKKRLEFKALIPLNVLLVREVKASGDAPSNAFEIVRMDKKLIDKVVFRSPDAMRRFFTAFEGLITTALRNARTETLEPSGVAVRNAGSFRASGFLRGWKSRQSDSPVSTPPPAAAADREATGPPPEVSVTPADDEGDPTAVTRSAVDVARTESGDSVPPVSSSFARSAPLGPGAIISPRSVASSTGDSEIPEISGGGLPPPPSDPPPVLDAPARLQRRVSRSFSVGSKSSLSLDGVSVVGSGDGDDEEGDDDGKQRVEEERKLEKELLEKERLEKERLEKERLEKERLEKERLEKERLEKERLEKERLEKERLEKERLEKERLEKERLEKERLEKERLEKERLEKERLEKERLEKERLEKERLEKERLEKERLDKERLDKERLDKERLEKERLEKERRDQELEQLRRDQDRKRRDEELLAEERRKDELIKEQLRAKELRNGAVSPLSDDRDSDVEDWQAENKSPIMLSRLSRSISNSLPSLPIAGLLQSPIGSPASINRAAATSPDELQLSPKSIRVSGASTVAADHALLTVLMHRVSMLEDDNKRMRTTVEELREELQAEVSYRSVLEERIAALEETR